MNISIAIQDAFILLFSGDETLWTIVWVSLKTSLVGLAFATPPALLLGYTIASHAFPGRRIAIWLVQAALSLPTVLIGLLLYLLLSRQGLLGSWQWLFSQTGITTVFTNLEGFPDDWQSNPEAFIKFVRDHQCPSFLEYGEYPYVTADEIKKALKLKSAFSDMLDQMQ